MMALLAATAVFAVSINWGASSYPIYDETGVGGTILADGDIVQLIWDQAGDGIDPAGCNGLPTDDDQLLDSSIIGHGAFPNTGKFSDNINTGLVGPDAMVYVRAWNTASLLNATHYGNSPLVTIDDAVAYTFDSTASGGFATTAPAAVCVTWGAMANPLYDENGALLADGDVVQLIWDQAADGIDEPDSDGQPTDDDQLLDSSSIGTGVSPNTGTFIDTHDNPTLVAGNRVYVRAWNDSSLVAATYYGDSTVFVIDSDSFWSLDATATGSYATTLQKPELAVSLAFFEAIQSDQAVVLSWETTSEIDNQGFNLYRSTDSLAPGAVLAFVPSQAVGSTQGFAYEWQDTNVGVGETYTYWLEDIDLNGVSTMHGPVSVTVLAPSAVSLAEISAQSRSSDLPQPSWLLGAAPAIVLPLLVGLRSRKRT